MKPPGDADILHEAGNKPKGQVQAKKTKKFPAGKVIITSQ